MTTLSNDIFKFNLQTNSVRVENISPCITINEVVALFNTLIGDIHFNMQNDTLTMEKVTTSLGVCLEIAFFNRDAVTKAMCMSGYTIQGQPLCVYIPCSMYMRIYALPPIDARPLQHTDDRRNLYVLGLPFALTKSEFSNVFSRYGTVMHCVILATVDNSSRRRGFVVMSSHEEAKLAMASLTRTQIKGHTLDISWAVVQRSQGFLDGGDRNMLLDSRSPPRSVSRGIRHDNPEIADANSSASSIDSAESDLAAFTLSLVPTPTLFVTNLPAFLFAQVQDMQSLFYPFGHIKKLKILETSLKGSTSALVEYESAELAQEARETLHGQSYAGQQIAVRFVRSKPSLIL
ncbi:RNA-binding domain-containing protein [Tricholoma matsutake]|nr:RNA-binding domain-containing protein [Tricholoma matsutake 945]